MTLSGVVVAAPPRFRECRRGSGAGQGCRLVWTGSGYLPGYDCPEERRNQLPTWVLQALSAARKVPWKRVLAAIAWLMTRGRMYWDRLTPEERREVRELAVKSKGQRSNLTNAEQGRLIDLFAKIRREPTGDAK
jgi:hypothetical protein